jgi:predicted nucleic acid-binding protein
VIYLDSAAVVKLVRLEPGTADLVAWLNARAGSDLVSSALVEVEVPRALRRSAPAALPAIPAALSRLYRLEIDAPVRAAAAGLPDAGLRSLDAIHLATAAMIGAQLQAFVTYDVRLLAAAQQAGLPVASP